MRERPRVTRPPAKPLLIFDGDCDFCCRQIGRWRKITADRVDYRPSQAASIAAQFPEISRAHYQRSVQFIEPDGRVSSGAEAVCRALAVASTKRWPWWCYQRIPGFAPVAEWCYRFLAGRRGA